jgi:hypothetical protein
MLRLGKRVATHAVPSYIGVLHAENANHEEIGQIFLPWTESGL